MFTVSQIKDAHSKVKSGADFPGYVQDIIKLGVTGYETYVTDGHTVYFGDNGFKTQTDADYPTLEAAEKSDKSHFQQDLGKHQQGKSTYQDFCHDCAKSGIVKWKVDIRQMTCTYYDKDGHEILIEPIPIPL